MSCSAAISQRTRLHHAKYASELLSQRESTTRRFKACLSQSRTQPTNQPSNQNSTVATVRAMCWTSVPGRFWQEFILEWVADICWFTSYIQCCVSEVWWRSVRMCVPTSMDIWVDRHSHIGRYTHSKEMRTYNGFVFCDTGLAIGRGFEEGGVVSRNGGAGACWLPAYFKLCVHPSRGG